MRKIGLIVCVAALAACTAASSGDAPEAKLVAVARQNEVFKACDAGRAVYFSGASGRFGTGLFVIDNAPECYTGADQ